MFPPSTEIFSQSPEQKNISQYKMNKSAVCRGQEKTRPVAVSQFFFTGKQFCTGKYFGNWNIFVLVYILR